MWRCVSWLIGDRRWSGEPNAAQAAVVDITYDLTLNGMSSGTCPAGSCGTITVTGDTTSSLTYDVELAPGVSFHGAPNKLADFFYFDVTGGSGKTITADTLTGGSGYAYNGIVTGSFVPNPGNFPGPYNYAGTCTAGNGSGDPGSLCGDVFKFTVNGGSMADPLVIGAPLGHGLFPSDNIAFVADLSISGSCGDFTCTAGTGLVGSGAGTPISTPEPSTWAMMLVGFAGLAYAGFRKTKKARAAVSIA
jgi:PEP-CTERM motif